MSDVNDRLHDLDRVGVAVTKMQDDNEKRLREYVELGGEEHHYLDGKKTAYRSVLTVLAAVKTGQPFSIDPFGNVFIDGQTRDA